MKDINQQITNAAKWSTVTEILAKIITPLTNMALARLLTPQTFGVVATITMVISFAEIFTDAGFQKYIVQHEFASKEDFDKSTNVAFWTNLLVSGVICLGIFVFRHSIANLVGSPGYGNTISIAACMIFLTAFSSVQMARYKREFDFKTLFYARMGTALIPLVVTIPLALWLRNHWALLIGTFAGKMYHAIVLTLKSEWRPSSYYNFRLLREMFSYSVWILIGSVAVWLTEYMDIFLVGGFLGDHYLGLYKTAMTTVNSYMAIITASVLPVLFSALSRCQGDMPQFQSIFYKFQRMTAVLVFPMGVGMWLFSDLVTWILLGSQWTEAGAFIGLWSLTGTTSIVFSQLASEVYKSKGKPGIAVLTQIIHICCIVFVLLLVRDRGFQGIYRARALVRIQGALTSLLCMHLIFQFSILNTLRNIFPAAACAVAMGLFGWVLKPVFDSVIWQFGVIAMCVVFYFGMLFTLFPMIRKEILGNQWMAKLHK